MQSTYPRSTCTATIQRVARRMCPCGIALLLGCATAQHTHPRSHDTVYESIQHHEARLSRARQRLAAPTDGDGAQAAAQRAEVCAAAQDVCAVAASIPGEQDASVRCARARQACRAADAALVHAPEPPDHDVSASTEPHLAGAATTR